MKKPVPDPIDDPIHTLQALNLSLQSVMLGVAVGATVARLVGTGVTVG